MFKQLHVNDIRENNVVVVEWKQNTIKSIKNLETKEDRILAVKKTM